MRSFSCISRAVPLTFIGSTLAASLPMLPQRRDDLSPPGSASISFKNVADPYNFQVLNYDDQGIIYVANITVDGQSYEVELDTGSSDLWLNTQNITLSPQAQNTNISVSLTYFDTTAAIGDVYMASAQFGNFSIPTQAFINAPGSNATNANDRGLMGLSNANHSMIYKGLRNTTYNALPPLYNIFAAYPDLPQYITFLLARSGLGATDGGILTIGEVDANWSDVLNQPKIVVPDGRDRWVGYMDAMIVNGKKYSGHGRMAENGTTEAQKQQTVVALDTGTTFGLLPKYYFDAMYSDIPDFKLLDKDQGIYSLPCDTKKNISMVFNGIEYPINPLDLTTVVSLGDVENNNSNKTICVTTFQSGDLSHVQLDMLLGDSFMRNVYSLFNFGNWTTPVAEPAYMQILSTTNQTAAWEQFDDLNTARIQNWDALNAQYSSLASA